MIGSDIIITCISCYTFCYNVYLLIVVDMTTWSGKTIDVVLNSEILN